MTRTTVRKTLALLTLTSLGACQGFRFDYVNLPPEERAASAGPQPSPEAAAVIADLYLRKGLKDYDTAKIQWGGDVRLATWFEEDPAQKDPRVFRRIEVAGWEFFANVNAKNGFGAYSGWQPWRFRFRQDRLAAAEPVSAAPVR